MTRHIVFFSPFLRLMKRHLAEKTQMKKKRTAGSAIGFAVSATVWTAESLLLRSSGKVRTKDARVKFSQTGGSQRHPTKLRRLAVRTQEQDVDLSGALPWFVPEKISEKEKKGGYRCGDYARMQEGKRCWGADCLLANFLDIYPGFGRCQFTSITTQAKHFRTPRTSLQLRTDKLKLSIPQIYLS